MRNIPCIAVALIALSRPIWAQATSTPSIPSGTGSYYGSGENTTTYGGALLVMGGLVLRRRQGMLA